MTEYIIELYEKGKKKPYERFRSSIEDRTRPDMCSEEKCFGGRLNDVYRARVYYYRNGKYVAQTYTDSKGRKRLSWKY